MAGMVRAVALDLDGTLTDGGGVSAAAPAAVDAVRDGRLVDHFGEEPERSGP